MKLLFFKYGKDYELVKKGKNDMFERVMFTAFIFLFMMIIFAQVSLLSPDSSGIAAVDSSIEGAPLGVEEYLYSKGTVDLRLMSGESDPSLMVLINGEKAGVFEGKDIKLNVIEGDVIEIDGSNTIESEVAVCAVSDNIERDCVGEIYATKGNIKRVMQVKSTAENH